MPTTPTTPDQPDPDQPSTCGYYNNPALAALDELQTRGHPLAVVYALADTGGISRAAAAELADVIARYDARLLELAHRFAPRSTLPPDPTAN